MMSLPAIRIVGTTIGPHLLIFGGVHGDEFEPMAAIRRLAATVSADDLRGRLTLVPVVNGPAFLRGHRVAEDGLDLARTFPGRVDGSITERIAHAASALIRSADYFIDLHTGGTTMTVWPLAGYTLHSDPQVLAQQRRMARAFQLPVVWGTSPALEGRSLSVARDANIPAIYTEYGGGGTCCPQGVEAYIAGCTQVMAMLGMLDLSVRTPARQIVVEDDRPGSGHLQVANPSPATGFFEPAVTLGQNVQTGDLLGTVSDPLGQRIVPVRAKEGGRVLVLRTFSRVLQDESLALVLETRDPSR